MFEETQRFLRSLKTTTEVSVPIEDDADGYFDREWVVSRVWWKFSNGVLRAWRFRPDQAAWSRVKGSMG